MNIPISPKHGLNPSLLICPVCAQAEGVALLGRLPEDRAAPRQILDGGPCQKCRTEFEALKDKGFVLFVIRDEGAGARPPWQYYRGVHVITRESADRLFKSEHTRLGSAFITESFALSIGLAFPPQEEPKK